MSERREAAAAAIQAAFGPNPYPGDEAITAYARVRRSIADSLRGHVWQDVPLEVLFQHRWEIFLLAPPAFRYYTPLFLLAALYHFHELESFADNLLFCLTPQRQEHLNNYFAGEYRDYFSRRAASYSSAEKAAIVAFLEAYQELVPQDCLLYDLDIEGQTLAFWRRA